MINPFALFNITQEFEIDDLDAKYYELFAYCQDQAKLNDAYKILKDPVARAIKLCQLNGFSIPDSMIAKEIFNAKVDKNMLDEARENIFKYARQNDWANTWIWAQKYSYIKRILS